MDRLEALARLAAGPVLGLLDEAEMLGLVRLGRLSRVAAGSHVLRHEDVRSAYVILEGRVTAEAPLREGDILELSTVLGRGARWTRPWLADTELALMEVPSEALRAAIAATPMLAAYLERVENDAGVRRLRNDLRLLGWSPRQIFWTVGSLEACSKDVLPDSGAALLVVQSGQFSVTRMRDRALQTLAAVGPGQYLLARRVDGIFHSIEPGSSFWRLELETWRSGVGAEQVAAFEAIADPLLTQDGASPDPAAPRKLEPEDDELEAPDGPSIASFQCRPEELQRLQRKRPNVVLQHDELDCGAACLATVAQFHGRHIDVPTYRSLVHVTRDGASMLALKKAAEATGFEALGVLAGSQALLELRTPFIALLDFHFVVVHKVSAERVVLGDPALGVITQSAAEFKQAWSKSALLLRPTEALARYPESRATFCKYLGLLRGSLPSLLEMLAASLLVVLFGLAVPVFLQYLVDTVVPARRPDAMAVAGAGLLTLLASRDLMAWVRRYLLSHLAARLDALFSSLLIRQLLALPLSFFAVRTVGDITQRLIDLSRIRQLLLGQGLTIFTALLGLGINLLVLALYSPTLLLGLLLTLLVPALLLTLASSRLADRLRSLYRAEGSWQSRANEQFQGLASIRGANAQLAARWRFAADFGRALEQRRKVGLFSAVTAASSDFLERAMEALMLGLAVQLYMSGELSLGHVLAATVLSTSVIAGSMNLLSSWVGLRDVGVSLGRVDDVMTAATESDGAEASGFELSGKVSLERVSFQYGNETSPIVLDGISLEIEPGETVALVGESGSGKTTLGYVFNLLYAPSGGHVRFDGVDAHKLPLATIRKQVAMIVQDNAVFSGSILDNIALGDPHPSFERVVAAAEAADAHDFIAGLPDGYSTRLGEFGEGLSGGQRQRLNIARALYREPRILVMDEATSLLDAISEGRIVKNLQRRRGTTIVIAHRLNTIQHADRIVVLAGGQVRESGSHQELLKKGGEYSRLFARQLAV